MADAREIVARQIAQIFIPAYCSDECWNEDLDLWLRRRSRSDTASRDNVFAVADAILSALSAAGFAIVPREATEEMISIGAKRIVFLRHPDHLVLGFVWAHDPDEFKQEAKNAWRAMVAAAEGRNSEGTSNE